MESRDPIATLAAPADSPVPVPVSARPVQRTAPRPPPRPARCGPHGGRRSRRLRRLGCARRGLAVAGLLGLSGAPLEAVAYPSDAASVPIDVEYSTGFDYSRGDYGLDRDSTLLFVPVGVTVDRGYFRFGLSIPLLYSDGVTSSTLGGVGGPVTSETDRVGGLGQVVTSGSYLIDPPVAALPWVELGGQVLWPTRTAEPLGTGGFGFTVQLDLFEAYRLGSSPDANAREDASNAGPTITPFATLGRNFYLVDSLRDRFFTTVGLALRLTDRVSGGLAYDWFQSTSPDLDDAHQLVPYLSFAISKRWSVGPYAVAGLSDGAPDYGVGLSIRVRP